MIMVRLFKKKCLVPRQVKGIILALSNKKGQSNLSIVFIFVCCKKKKKIIFLSFRVDDSVLTATGAAGAIAASKVQHLNTQKS